MIVIEYEGDNMEKKKQKKEKVREVIVEKKEGFNTVEVAVIVIISMLFGVVIGSAITNSKKNIAGTRVSPEMQEFVATYNSIKTNYYNKTSDKKLMNAAIKGMVNSLDDPYSIYMDKKETTNFNQTVSGRYSGIGATISSKDGKNHIVGLFDGSPAKKAGLKEGDSFIKVNGQDVSTYDLEKLTNMIKGKPNTKVTITVLRGDKEITKTITRQAIDIPSVESKIIEKENKKIGYIYISAFSSNTYEQFKKELKKTENKKIDSLIIDVRSNPGGHLNQVTKILDLFMSKNKVLYQTEIKGNRIKKYSDTKENRKYKVGVLINSGSASASEILAGAFKESYDNSVIVGTKSYGKGTVQKAYQLATGSSIKYTTEKWLTPKGNWIDKKGIEPTYNIELTEEYRKDPNDDNDSQLQKAIEVLIK